MGGNQIVWGKPVIFFIVLGVCSVNDNAANYKLHAP